MARGGSADLRWPCSKAFPGHWNSTQITESPTDSDSAKGNLHNPLKGSVQVILKLKFTWAWGKVDRKGERRKKERWMWKQVYCWERGDEERWKQFCSTYGTSKITGTGPHLVTEVGCLPRPSAHVGYSSSSHHLSLLLFQQPVSSTVSMAWQCGSPGWPWFWRPVTGFEPQHTDH